MARAEGDHDLLRDRRDRVHRPPPRRAAARSARATSTCSSARARRSKLDELIERWGAQRTASQPVIGDLTQAEPRRRRGAGSTSTEGKVDHFFHLAAIYDMTADDELNETAQRRRHAQRRRAGQRAARPASCTTPPRSPPPASYKGLFREDMFDEGQKLPSPYHRTKFESEKIAREESTRARGASTARRSSSATPRPARWTRSTGPTTSSRRSRSCATRCPSGCRSSGRSWATRTSSRSTSSPRAMDHIAHQPDLDGQAFHLTNPRSQRSGEVLNAFAKAAHAPQLAMRIDKRLIDALPKGVVLDADAAAAAQGRAPRRSSPTSASPTRSSSTSASPREFDTRDTERALEGSGIEVPQLEQLRREAVGLLGAQPRPRPVQGPLVRGARSTARRS